MLIKREINYLSLFYILLSTVSVVALWLGDPKVCLELPRGRVVWMDGGLGGAIISVDDD